MVCSQQLVKDRAAYPRPKRTYSFEKLKLLRPIRSVSIVRHLDQPGPVLPLVSFSAWIVRRLIVIWESIPPLSGRSISMNGHRNKLVSFVLFFRSLICWRVRRHCFFFFNMIVCLFEMVCALCVCVCVGNIM